MGPRCAVWARQEDQAAADPAADSAGAAGQSRNRPQEAEAKRQQAPASGRSEQRTGGRVPDTGHVIAARYPARRDLRCLPPEVADRACVQTIKITAENRPIANMDRGGEPELALSAS